MTARLNASNSLFLTVTLGCLAIGTGLNLFVVRGTYEWLGIIRICTELFDRAGFWCLALVLWVAGIQGNGHSKFWGFVQENLIKILATSSCVLALISQTSAIPVGSFADMLALTTLIPLSLLWALRKHPRAESLLKPAARMITIGLGILICYTSIGYFHTMIKGCLFIFAAPQDALLWKLDDALLPNGYFSTIGEWRIRHPSIVGLLDIAYIGLLQQICWSVFFFLGLENATEARRYLISMILIYVLGPIFYFLVPSQGPLFFSPAHFNDLIVSAPETWHLSKFLLWSTYTTLTGSAHDIAPFSFIAAMPSLHVGIAAIMLVAMRKSLIATIFNIGMLATTIIATSILGWHYLSDALIGGGLGIMCWLFATKVVMYDADEHQHK